MRFTTYTRYRGRWLDAFNLEALLEHLSDFLMNGGFAGGPHYHPFWGWSGTDDHSSADSLKQALLRALIESGQLTPEMLEELRGEGGGYIAATETDQGWSVSDTPMMTLGGLFILVERALTAALDKRTSKPPPPSLGGGAGQAPGEQPPMPPGTPGRRRTSELRYKK